MNSLIENKMFVLITKNDNSWKNILKEQYFKVFKEKLNDEDILINDFGKPYSKKCFFSISHSKNVLTIAFGKDCEIGIDVQYCKLTSKLEKFRDKICTKKELQLFNKKDLNEKNLIKLWTKKESTFKLCGNKKIFEPKTLDLADYYFFEKELNLANQTYILTIATKNKTNFNFI